MNQDNTIILVIICVITFLILYKDLDKNIKNSLLIICILYGLYIVLNKVNQIENNYNKENFALYQNDVDFDSLQINIPDEESDFSILDFIDDESEAVKVIREKVDSKAMEPIKYGDHILLLCNAMDDNYLTGGRGGNEWPSISELNQKVFTTDESEMIKWEILSKDTEFQDNENTSEIYDPHKGKDVKFGDIIYFKVSHVNDRYLLGGIGDNRLPYSFINKEGVCTISHKYWNDSEQSKKMEKIKELQWVILSDLKSGIEVGNIMEDDRKGVRVLYNDKIFLKISGVNDKYLSGARNDMVLTRPNQNVYTVSKTDGYEELAWIVRSEKKTGERIYNEKLKKDKDGKWPLYEGQPGLTNTDFKQFFTTGCNTDSINNLNLDLNQQFGKSCNGNPENISFYSNNSENWWSPNIQHMNVYNTDTEKKLIVSNPDNTKPDFVVINLGREMNIGKGQLFRECDQENYIKEFTVKTAKKDGIFTDVGRKFTTNYSYSWMKTNKKINIMVENLDNKRKVLASRPDNTFMLDYLPIKGKRLPGETQNILNVDDVNFYKSYKIFCENNDPELEVCSTYKNKNEPYLFFNRDIGEEFGEFGEDEEAELSDITIINKEYYINNVWITPKIKLELFKVEGSLTSIFFDTRTESGITQKYTYACFKPQTLEDDNKLKQKINQITEKDVEKIKIGIMTIISKSNSDIRMNRVNLYTNLDMFKTKILKISRGTARWDSMLNSDVYSPYVLEINDTQKLQNIGSITLETSFYGLLQKPDNYLNKGYIFNIDEDNSSTTLREFTNFKNSNLLGNGTVKVTLRNHSLQDNGGNNNNTLESISFPRQWTSFTVEYLGKDPNYFSSQTDKYGQYTPLTPENIYENDIKGNIQPVIALKTVHKTYLSVLEHNNSLTQFRSNSDVLPYHRRNERFIIETIKPGPQDVFPEDEDIYYRYKIKSLATNKYLKVDFDKGDFSMVDNSKYGSDFIIESDTGFEKCLAVDPDQNDHLEFNINRKAQFVKITPLSYVGTNPTMKIKLLEKNTNTDILKQLSLKGLDPESSVNNQNQKEFDLGYEQFIRGVLIKLREENKNQKPERCNIMIANNDKVFRTFSTNSEIKYENVLNGKINLSVKARYITIKILKPNQPKYDSIDVY